MDTLDQIYKLRRDFIIIGLTGRTGSGCTTVADILTKDISEIRTKYHKKNDGEITNETRKDAVIHNFLSSGNWEKFEKITASDVIFLFVLNSEFSEFKDLITAGTTDENRKREIEAILDKSENSYNTEHVKATRLFKVLKDKEYKNWNEEEINDYKALKDFLLVSIPKFRDDLTKELAKIDKKILTSELQKWGNNIRKFGNITTKPINDIQEYAPACLAMMINRIAKMIRKIHQFEGNEKTRIVIDALRNPFEILYFRERFSAFYTIAVTTDHQTRYDRLSEKGISKVEAQKIDDAEKAKNNFSSSYQEIDVDRCIELSDIFLSHDGTPAEKNRHLHNQITRYIALILHPGLVPPSPLERVMQVAYTAKLNSGCLSRQVGAAITDQFFSVKAIGWNTVPEGQTPCSLRRLTDLVEDEDEKAYSDFETHDIEFRKFTYKLCEAYKPKFKTEDKGNNEGNQKLESIGLPYCFKDLYTTCFSKHKGNQVHTRSMHAEENAFLQLAKYGSQGIKGGKLFTTASCCELCGKKAYQLGIKEIYYIDSYPGITESHILKCGTNRPEMKLFHGAIGSAYIALYEPFLPLKDEVEELTGIHPKRPLDYQRTVDDKIIPKKEEELDYIVVECDVPAILKEKFCTDIEKQKIGSWELDKEGDITTTLDDKRKLCWFRIKVTDKALLFKLIKSKQMKQEDEKKLKAIFYGRLVATLYANFMSFNFKTNVDNYFKPEKSSAE